MADGAGWKGHDVVLVKVAGANGRLLPAVILDGGECLESGLDWLRAKYKDRSSTQLNDGARALGLLADFHSRTIGKQAHDIELIDKLLIDFADALAWGTVDTDTRKCPYGLYWKPLGLDQGKRYVRHAERYCEYLFAESGWRPTRVSAAEQRMIANFRPAWARSSAAGGLLSHLKGSRRSANAYSHGGFDPTLQGRPTPFPEDLILPLLTEGCRRERRLTDMRLPQYLREYNVRNQLAFLMIFGLGIRSEELFHIFATDVVPGPKGRALVYLYHPVKGAYRWTKPGSTKDTTVSRSIYLRGKYGLKPRNTYNKKENQWAGWKNLLLQVGAPHFYSRGFWIDNWFGEVFQSLHALYVKYHRAPLPDFSPYYFVSLDGGSRGQPWSMRAFQKEWQRALCKIGATQGKAHGTNPHAGRHYYGQRAAEMGVDPRLRQIMMHHTSIISQFRYQMPSPDQVDKHLDEAQQKMLASSSGAASAGSGGGAIPNVGSDELDALLSERSGPITADTGLPDLQGLSKVDPLGLMSSWKLYRGLDRR